MENSEVLKMSGRVMVTEMEMLYGKDPIEAHAVQTLFRTLTEEMERNQTHPAIQVEKRGEKFMSQTNTVFELRAYLISHRELRRLYACENYLKKLGYTIPLSTRNIPSSLPHPRYPVQAELKVSDMTEDPILRPTELIAESEPVFDTSTLKHVSQEDLDYLFHGDARQHEIEEKLEGLKRVIRLRAEADEIMRELKEKERFRKS